MSNAGLVVGRDTALVVDALYVRSMTQAFKRAIKKTSTKPLRYIVCTHHHADHTLGLLWFPEEIPIIAHRFMKERMQETGLDLAHYREVNPEHKKELRGIRQRFPSLTFEGEVAFDLGGRRVELLHFGHAHSKGDIVVHVPDEGVV